MSREGSYDAFRKWADEKLDEVRRRECLYCGFLTRHPSQTCPAHRDLARTIPGLDIPDGYGLESPDAVADPRGHSGVADLRRDEDVLGGDC